MKRDETSAKMPHGHQITINMNIMLEVYEKVIRYMIRKVSKRERG